MIERCSCYQEITAATAALLTKDLPLISPNENPDVFDVSLVAGHAGLFESKALHFDDLTSFAEEALQDLRAFEALDIVPLTKIHLTLLPLFQNKPRDFGSQANLQRRARQYDALMGALEAAEPVTVTFDGLCLTPTGAVILQGFSAGMSGLRSLLSKALPDADRTPSRTSHVTLARLRRPLPRVEFRALFDWTSQWRHRELLGPLQIVCPRLVATGDQNGTIILDSEMTSLSKWNRRFPELGDRRRA